MTLDPDTQLASVLPAEEAQAVGPEYQHADIQTRIEDESELPIQQLGQGALIWRRFRRHRAALVGAVMFIIMCVIALIGPWITPEPSTPTLAMLLNPHQNFPPHLTYRYLFGTDQYGSSVMMQVILGARTSLEVGMGAAGIATLLGIIIGAVSGYFGGFTDSVMMRITDVFLTLPFLPLLLLATKIWATGGVTFIIIIFGVLGWPGVARLIRSYYLTFREQEFVDAARAVGVSAPRIIFRHIMPNSLSPVIVSFTLAVAAYISAEAAIDFLGLGLKAPDISWGLALQNTQQSVMSNNWWSIIFPGLALLFTVLAVNFLGDGLRDALDVRSKAGA